ncbi:MAG: GAF domain-containing protein [Acidobacteria bacterium]|nr:GAF domain-containing protein [Acidobacteriota bacterium]
MDSTRTASGNLAQGELLQSLVEIFHHVTGATGGVLALDPICEILLTLQDYCSVWLHHRDEESGQVRLQYHLGLPAPLLAMQENTDFSRCVADFVLRTGQPMALRDLAHCRRLPADIIRQDLEMKAHLSVPVNIDGRTTDVLHVGVRHARRFLIHEIRFLAVVAGAMGLLFQKDQMRGVGDDHGRYLFETGAQTIISSLVDGILMVERDFRFTIWDPAGRSFLEGFTEIEKGECYDQLSHLFPVMLRCVDNGHRVYETEITLNQPPGKCLRVTATPLGKPGPAVERLLVSVKDLTREKVTARKEQLEARISSVSAFLEGITHELYNPLTAVSGYLQLLLSKLDAPTEVTELAWKMDLELNRAIGLVRELVDHARQGKLVRQPVHPGQLLRQLAEEIRESFQGTAVAVHIDVEEELPLVDLDRTSFRQALQGLLEFSAQKLRDGGNRGVLHVSAQQIDEVLHIAVRDNHPGLFEHPPDEEEPAGPDVQRDYEVPLAFCFRVMRDHGGVMYAQTEPGKGLGYVVKLPLQPVVK